MGGPALNDTFDKADQSAPFPGTIRLINRLSPPQKEAIYRTLLPDLLFQHFAGSHDLTLNFRCPYESRSAEISVYREAGDVDPMLYLHLADTFNNQLFVLLVIANDLDAPRFPIDQLPDGSSTKLGTQGRNIPAETAALHAGLAPGQVRAGLRLFKQLVPCFEAFVTRMGQSYYFIEPMAYHNAIVFERYGFQYVRGRAAMERIQREFQPGGTFFQQLDGSNPFREPSAAESVRGRSWAIQDGILGQAYTGFEMVKHIGHHAGVNTFPGSIW